MAMMTKKQLLVKVQGDEYASGMIIWITGRMTLTQKRMKMTVDEGLGLAMMMEVSTAAVFGKRHHKHSLNGWVSDVRRPTGPERDERSEPLRTPTLNNLSNVWAEGLVSRLLDHTFACMD